MIGGGKLQIGHTGPGEGVELDALYSACVEGEVEQGGDRWYQYKVGWNAKQLSLHHAMAHQCGQRPFEATPHWLLRDRREWGMCRGQALAPLMLSALKKQSTHLLEADW